MFERILVPLDGSGLAEKVLPYVRLLAKPDYTPITLLRAIEPLPHDLIAVSQGTSSQRVSSRLRAESMEYLEKVAAPFREQRIPALVKVIGGTAAPSIVEQGGAEPGTLIAMSTHGRSGVARWAFGSVTDKVLHATDSPLLIVRSPEGSVSNDEVTIKDIIVPLDGSELAEQVLPYASDLAQKLGLGVTLVRATPSPGDYYRFMDYALPESDDLPEQMEAEALAYLEMQGQRLRQREVGEVQERLIHGPAAIAVTEFARKSPDSLVAMTTHGRSGLGRWILGSVADRVIRHSGNPVLVITVSKHGKTNARSSHSEAARRG